jgi:fumarylacetoacetase
VASACRAGTDFPLQNLPHGVFSTGGAARGGVAIGDEILDLQALLELNLVPRSLGELVGVAARSSLNHLAALGNDAAAELRAGFVDMLATDGALRGDVERHAGLVLVPQRLATMHLPLCIGSFTDFMTSVYHVTAARRSRPARPLNDNFLHLPVAYNSRATSITQDGVPFPRPWGQRREADGSVVFAPTAMLDFELEFGAIIGRGNALGSRISLDDAGHHIFGYVLVNDWSARDIQQWESRLGPFLGKSFRTTISPWIVTATALAPFHVAPKPRSSEQPQPLSYLDSPAHRRDGALSVSFEVHLQTARMRATGIAPARIVTTELAYCAWSFPQMVTHHTSNGCNLEPGDLLSCGTISGPADESAACLFERTAGTLPLDLPNGEQRCWLEDGDEITLIGRARREGYVDIGFGRCGARILPAH